MAKQIQTIPLSNSSISRKILDISDDLRQQLKSSMTGKLFALQVDEATDSSQDCLLMGYTRLVHGKAFLEELLFCEYVEGRCTAQELFTMIEKDIVKNNLEWDHSYGVCTDGAAAMEGKQTGLRTLTKKII